MAVKNCFIRGSVVRYVQLPAEHVDTQLLEDATRRGRLRSSYCSYPATCMSDYCLVTNRGCESSQAVILVCPIIIQTPYALHCSLCLTNLPEGCIATTIYITSRQISRVRDWITPNLDCTISTGSDQFSSLHGVMFCPCYDLMVYLRGRVRFEGLCLHQKRL
jgi:hypothetical protein